MNNNALRVPVTIKCNSNENTSTIRDSTLILPATKLLSTLRFDADTGGLEHKFKSNYLLASTIEEQLSAIASIINTLAKKECTTLSEPILYQILTDIYFHAPLKHPIRSTISRALQRELTINHNSVISAISKTITESDTTVKVNLTSNVLDEPLIISYVSSLLGCFENFDAARNVIRSHMKAILNTICCIIDIFLRKIKYKEDLSPAKRSKQSASLHNAIRVVLFVVQKNQDKVIDAEILRPIYKLCWLELLEDAEFADLLMDTKINCAIIKIYFDRACDRKFDAGEWTQNKCSNKSESSENHLLSKKMYLGIATINTMSADNILDTTFCDAIRLIIEHLVDVGETYTMESIIMMAITRALAQFCRKTLHYIRNIESQLTDAEIKHLRSAAHQCLNFVWLNVEHSVECVRYATKDLLKSLLRMGHDEDTIFGQLIHDSFVIIRANITNSLLTCMLLENLSQILRTERIMREIPDIREHILNEIFDDTAWSTCYERLMITNCREISLTAWCDRWIRPLIYIEAEKWRHDPERIKTIRNLLERALKTKPEAAEFVLSRENISIEIYLFVLWIMRKSGRKLYSPENYCVSTDPRVKYARTHQSDDVRILALRILTDYHKLSEEFSVDDLAAILEFFKYNCNTQNPTTRQEIISVVRRTMERIECGYFVAKRSNTDHIPILLEQYQTFLYDWIKFCNDWCLIEGANFGRRSVGLITLHIVIETWQKLYPDKHTIYTEQLWIKLQKMLGDTYAVNREAASEILKGCRRFYVNPKLVFDNLDDLGRMLTTFRPNDTMTAAQYLIFCSNTKSHFDSNIDAVAWCEKLLDEGLNIAQQSLIQMARYNSLYGLVLGIRQLLGCTDFRRIVDPAEISKWRAFFQRMINRSRKLTDVVAPIVNSSAPEGHLPINLNDESYYISSKNQDISQLNSIKVTAQMILVCSWRIVRETALLLGEIANRIPITKTEDDYGFITINQMLEMCRHFQLLLTETKHRGAFEQSFLGFSNLCFRLWRSEESVLYSYPIKLVENIAAVVAGESLENSTFKSLDVSKLCVTRRSAGIPYMIQAIVAAEAKVFSNVTITFSLETFLRIARTSENQDSRTHSLNILRALFKCTELGEAVSGYISDGIACSICGYNAPSWPERNSSTLLFSAIMTRIFGVQRSKQMEKINIKNRMTGHVFFIRYPRLYDFFYAELELASKAIQQEEIPSRLHPLLLLISRLYPSGAGSIDSNSKLLSFVPFISACSSSPELMTRKLTAKSIVALVPFQSVIPYCLGLLDSIKTENSLNACHGYLLQLLHIFRAHKQQIAHHNFDDLILLLNLFLQIDFPENIISIKTSLDIIIEILMMFQNSASLLQFLDRLTAIRDLYIDHLGDLHHPYQELTRSYVQKSFTIFNILVSANISDEHRPVIITQPITTSNYELLETQLNIKLLIWRHKANMETKLSDIGSRELELINYLVKNRKLDYIEALLPTTKELLKILDHNESFCPFTLIKTYEVLSIISSLSVQNGLRSDVTKMNITQMIEIMESTEADNIIDELSESIWKYINAQFHYINIDGLSDGDIMNLTGYIRAKCHSQKLSGLRLQAAETIYILISKRRMYFQAKLGNLDVLIDICDLLLGLLRDDDAHIRNYSAQTIMQLINRPDSTESQNVISLYAEDRLLEWLDNIFSFNGTRAGYKNWTKLIQNILITGSSKVGHSGNAHSCVSNEIIDIDIFDISELNTFDEPSYTLHKYTLYLNKYIDNP